MVKIDYWWDDTNDGFAPDFDKLLSQVMAWRPVAQVPVLAVIGNVQRFYGSALYKSTWQTGLLQAVNFDDMKDEDLQRPDVVFMHWGYISPLQRSRIPAGVRVLNDNDLDVSKENVESKFAAVAGYSSFVDPTTSTGLAIVKSKLNGVHDGRIVQLPLASFAADSAVCQHLVNNILGDYAVDIRVGFVVGQPLFAVIKFRERGRRFDNANASAKLVMPAQVLTEDELDLCRRFCGAMGLDYVELDILRDGRNGKIYIVDANNCPAGPTKALSPGDRQMTLRLIATGFRQHVLRLPC